MNVTVSLGTIRDNSKHRPATPHILNWELHHRGRTSDAGRSLHAATDRGRAWVHVGLSSGPPRRT
jgi:hypothetical protein